MEKTCQTNDFDAYEMPYMFVYVFQGVVLLMSNIVSPLFSSIADALEAIILTLHNEDFSL